MHSKSLNLTMDFNPTYARVKTKTIFNYCLPSMWPSFQTRNRVSVVNKSFRSRFLISGSTRVPKYVNLFSPPPQYVSLKTRLNCIKFFFLQIYSIFKFRALFDIFCSMLGNLTLDC